MRGLLPLLLARCLLAIHAPVAAQAACAGVAGLLRGAQAVFDPGDSRRAHGLAQATLAWALYEGAQGPDHPETASSLKNLASVHRTPARYTSALPCQRRAVAIYQKNIGPAA